MASVSPTINVTPHKPSDDVLPTGICTVSISGSAGWNATSAALILSEAIKNENSPVIRKPVILRTGTELKVDLPVGTTMIGIVMPVDNEYQVWLNTVSSVTVGGLEPAGWPLYKVGTSLLTLNTEELDDMSVYFCSPTADPEVDLTLELLFL